MDTHFCRKAALHADIFAGDPLQLHSVTSILADCSRSIHYLLSIVESDKVKLIDRCAALEKRERDLAGNQYRVDKVREALREFLA